MRFNSVLHDEARKATNQYVSLCQWIKWSPPTPDLAPIHAVHKARVRMLEADLARIKRKKQVWSACGWLGMDGVVKRFHALYERDQC